MATAELTGNDIAEILKAKKYKIKASTRTSLTVLVKGDRYKAIEDLTNVLSNLNAKHDPNAKGSSIGAVLVGKVKIMIKSEGRTGGLDVEARAIQMLDQAIKGAVMASGGPITIRMKHRTVKDIIGVEKTNGTPKSDFHCIDKQGKPQIFISHKKGSKPTDFQQWGGMTEKQIAEHPVTEKFALIAQAEYGDKMPAGESLAGILPDKREAAELKLMSVYGVDALKKRPGINCVDVLIQGDPSLKRISEGVYTFESSGHIHYFPDIPKGEFDPVPSIIYKGDRTNLGIKGGRASIYPLKGRKFKRIKEVKL
jgi:hypothetical protein